MGERDGLHALRSELAGLTAKYLVADGRISQAATPSLNPISTSYDSIAALGRGRSKCGPGSRGSEPLVTPPRQAWRNRNSRSRAFRRIFVRIAMSAPVSSKTSPSRIHYAWIVVAVTFATSVITAGTLGISGILLLPLQQEFGWNASDMSSAFGSRLALFGLLGPFTATLMNRFAVRRMVTIALSIILAGLVGTLFMTTAWEFFLFWGLLTGVGIGLTAMVLSATLATRS